MSDKPIRLLLDGVIVMSGLNATQAQSFLGGEIADGVHPADQSLFTRQLDLAPVKAWQFHAVLRASGLGAALESALAGLSEPDQSIARARLEYSDTYDRFDPLVSALGAAMGIAEGDLDDLWRQASALGNAA